MGYSSISLPQLRICSYALFEILFNVLCSNIRKLSSVVSFLFPLSVGIKSHCLTLCLVFGKFEGKCKRKKLEGKNVFLKKLISLIFYFYFLLLYKKMK